MNLNPPIPSESFALLCYLILMQNGEGIMDKHISYITEKQRLLESGYSAFGALDIHNMRKVKEWCEKWKFEMPEAPRIHLEQCEKAAAELEARGVTL